MLLSPSRWGAAHFAASGASAALALVLRALVLLPPLLRRRVRFGIERGGAGLDVAQGADKGYDTADFIAACRERGVTPHVAQHTTNRRSRIDDRVTRHAGYAVSQRVRKRVEEIFG